MLELSNIAILSDMMYLKVTDFWDSRKIFSVCKTKNTEAPPCDRVSLTNPYKNDEETPENEEYTFSNWIVSIVYRKIPNTSPGL